MGSGLNKWACMNILLQMLPHGKKIIDLPVEAKGNQDEEVELNEKIIVKKEEAICKICRDLMEIESSSILTWGHIYHTDWLKQYISYKIEFNEYPIECPEWKYTFSNRTVSNNSTEDKYKLFKVLKLKLFFVKNDREFFNWPTPDCKNIYKHVRIEDEEDKEWKCPLFHCSIWNKTYWVKWRTEWHSQNKWIKGDGQLIDNDQQFVNLIWDKNLGRWRWGYFYEFTYGWRFIKCICNFVFWKYCKKDEQHWNWNNVNRSVHFEADISEDFEENFHEFRLPKTKRHEEIDWL